MNVDLDLLEVVSKPLTKKERSKINFKRRKAALLFIIPTIIYILIFCYLPMYGILIAFQDFIPGDEIFSTEAYWEN